MGMVLRDASCSVGKTCPRITKVDGSFEIIGTHVPDPDLPPDERRVRVPETMLPELAQLRIADFEAWLAQRRTRPGKMLRVQTLAQYGVASDDQDFIGYTTGAPAPVSPYREEFFQELREGAARGMDWLNLVVIDGEPTAYQRYANEWVYVDATAAGQIIRILDLAEHPAARVLLRTGDFWVVEDRHVALVRYDQHGQHQGEVGVDDTAAAGYIAAATLAWDLATPFTEWYGAHPQYRRAMAA